MKKGSWVLFIILSLCFASCESEFNINAPYEDVYVLNCILSNDNSIQYALISKNYFTQNGTVPAANSIEQNIKGVTIKIYINDLVFVMRDTTIQVTNSGNITLVNCYYVKNLIMNPGDVIRIEATVPDGSTVKSTVQISKIFYDYYGNADYYSQLYFPQMDEMGHRTKPAYRWYWINATGEKILCLPQLEVYYKKYEDGTFVQKKINIPLIYYYTIDEDGGSKPVSVEYSFNRYCSTTLEAINKTMQDISGNDPNKGNYIITKAVFSVISLEPILTKYYSANLAYSDPENFTTKLRQSDFSNIEGGKGLFGINYKFSKPLVVDSFYVKSFGYRYDPS